MRAMAFSLIVLTLASIATAQTSKPASIPTTAKDRKVHPATQPGQVLEITIEELGNFDFDQENGSPIPPDVQALSGVTIKLHGIMIPIEQADHISKFALISAFPANNAPPSLIQTTILVTCPPDKSVNFEAGQIAVQGTLKVGIVKEDGFIVQIFGVDNASVKPIPK